MAEFDTIDGVQLLRTMTLHVLHVRAGLQKVGHELERRSLVHDASKFSEEEFAGACRFSRAARRRDEYRAGLRQEKSTIQRHYSANSHHPEHHGKLTSQASLGIESAAEGMGFLDIIEMVCDWRGAYLGYGSQGTWEENMARQRERYYSTWFTDEQWWLVEQVAAFLAEDQPATQGGADV